MNRYRPLFLFLLLAGSLAWSEDKKVAFDQTYRTRDKLEVVLQADAGDVQLTRNERDECQVFVEYYENRCELDVVYNERNKSLEIDIDHHNWSMIKEGDSKDKDYAVIKIALPYKPDLDVQVELKAGKLDLQLGDLHVAGLRLKSWAGETRLDFQRPNRTELKTLDVDCKVGEVRLKHLGNANFTEADINGSIGEMTVDFTGDKIKRAMARLDLDIGATTVIVPEEVAVKMKVSKFLFLSEVNHPSWFRQEGNYYYSKNYKDQDDSLYLMVSTGIGELRVRVAQSD